MEQSDLNLLHMAPFQHLQTLIKSRRLGATPLISPTGSSPMYRGSRDHQTQGPPPSTTSAPAPTAKGQHANVPAEPHDKGIPHERRIDTRSYAEGDYDEIAQQLFDPSAIAEVLRGLGERETLILRELVACGGRANSRDLALYLTSGDLLNIGKEATPETMQGATPTRIENPTINRGSTQAALRGATISTYPYPYPVPHPHGVFELALRHLLLLGLLFWGKQTNFGGRDYTSGVYDGVLIVPQAVMNEVRNVQEREQEFDDPGLLQLESDDPELLRTQANQRYPTASANQRATQDHQSYAGTLISSTAAAGWDHQTQANQSEREGSIGTAIGEGLQALQRALYVYWSLVATMREGLPLVNNGLLSRYALRQVMEQLGPHLYRDGAPTLAEPEHSSAQEIRVENEVPRLLFIRLLLMKLGLLQERQGTLRAAPAQAFFSLPLLERARRCYRTWLEDAFWNEFMHLSEVIVRPGPAPLDPAHEEVVQARQAVVERVLHEQGRSPIYRGTPIHRGVTVGEWCDIATFVAHTKLYAPYLLFPRRYGARADRYSMGSNPYGWDFRLRHGWLTHREGWHLVEGGFIRSVIAGPLYWLGLVDLNNEDNATAFRLAQGVSLVTRDEPVSIEEPEMGRLVVQPNFELVALAPVSEALLINLDRFAERVGLERIAQYRLTRASVTRAIQMGLRAEGMQQLLEQASGGEIPQNVQYSLQEWERQARRIELWHAAILLEVEDAAALDALFADEQTRSLLGRRLTPTLVEVPRHQLAALQEALWQRDYLPALVSASAYDNPLENADPPTCEPQWGLREDGLLEPLYAVPNLYLAAELERISERDEATGWRRISAAALQRARDAGLSLEQIVRFLQDYCEGGVPGSFLIRLKLWGGGYEGQSTIRVEHAPLLALPAQVLQDLQADEELRTLLGAEVAQQLRLVHVAPDKLERVVELLRERGFEIGF